MTGVDARPPDVPASERMDAFEMAALHATGFTKGAQWSAGLIEASLSEPSAFAVQAPGAFAIGRVAADEAELHTLVVAPHLRRTGAATRLLAAFDEGARARGATMAFLEVAETNEPARALYARTGWEQVGGRRGYYGGTDALVLRKRL